MSTPINPFPSLEALLEDVRAILPTLEPRWTNIRPGDIGLTAADGALYVLFADALTPAGLLSKRNQLEALRILGATPRGATKAAIGLTVTLQTALGVPVTVPAGTLWQTTDGLVTFILDSTLTIPAGSLTAVGTATAERAGVAGNVAINTVLANTSSVAFISGALASQRGSGGTDAETDDEFALRSTGEFRSSGMLVKAIDFESEAQAVPGIYKATALVLTTFTSPATFTTPTPGHVTVLAIPTDGGIMTTTLHDAVLAALQAKSFADLVANNAIHVTDYQRLVVNVTYTVVAAPGTIGSAVIAACNDRLSQILDPRVWQAGREVSAFEIASALEVLAVVDRVRTLTVNGGSLLACGVYQVTTPGAFTGTTV